MRRGSITSTSPLKVASSGSTTGMPATLMSTSTSPWTPAIGDLVLYSRIEKRIYVIGKVT